MAGGYYWSKRKTIAKATVLQKHYMRGWPLEIMLEREPSAMRRRPH